MTSGKRFALALVAAALVVGAVLGWLQWPPGAASDTARQERAEPVAREARIEALREEIERELERLQTARAQQDRTQAELRALEGSLEETRQRVHELEEALETSAGDGS
jgi:chromosome segregation ATPase